jgi:hypothetical protein
MVERKPTPAIKGNLPHHASENWDERQGRELPARRPEWYERSDPRGIMGSLRQNPWEPPKDALGSGRGMTEADLAALHRQDPEHYADPKSYTADPKSYRRGGPVKHGSPTHVACKTKDQ